MSIWAGTGASGARDELQAGRAAAAMAVEGLGDQPVALVFVCASADHDQKAVLAGVREVTGRAPVVGATTAGHFSQGVLAPDGPGVGVLVLSGGSYRFGVASVEVAGNEDAGDAGRALARAARKAAGPASPHAALIVLTAGLEGQQQELLSGIYRATGAAVPVVGGDAADDWTFDRSQVLHDDRVLRHAAVGVWIAAQRPVPVAAAHGWTAVGDPVLVTRVQGDTLDELDGRPAQEVYFDKLGYDADQRREVAAASAVQTHHPLGMLQADGSHVLRFVTPHADGRLTSIMPIPAYSATQVMAAEPDDMLDVVAPVVQDALATETAPGVLIAFSCAGRSSMLADRRPEEAALLQRCAGDVPTFGLYTYGEYVRQRSVAGFHSGTLAALAL